MEPIEAILNKIEKEGGGVILLHDFDQNRDLFRVDYVLDLTRAILEYAVTNDYRVLAFGELIEIE